MFCVESPEALCALIGDLKLYEPEAIPTFLSDPARAEAIIWLLKDVLSEDQYAVLESCYSSEGKLSCEEIMQFLPELSCEAIAKNLTTALETLLTSPVKHELFYLAYIEDARHIENEIKFALEQGTESLNALSESLSRLLAINYFSDIPKLKKLAEHTIELNKLWEKMLKKTLSPEDEVYFGIINMEKLDLV